MDKPEPIKEVLAQARPSSAKCENCGYGLCWWDNVRKTRRKWCRRCIDVYERKAAMTGARAEKLINDVVEPLYMDAGIADLDKEIRILLISLDCGRDVFMYGPVGTGKTHAMAAMIRYYVYEGYECSRINFDDFCVEIRSTMSPAADKTEWQVIAPLKTVGKLFIDDLGLRSKQETDFAYVTLYSLLNKRQERRLPTFITSNKSIEQLGRSFDSRIASRLKTALVIKLDGEDRRV